MKIKDFDGEVKVLATKGNKSLIWIVKATLEPYVIVDNYDAKTNSWKYGSYYRSYEQAKRDFNRIKDSKLYKVDDKIVKASSVNDAINKVKIVDSIASDTIRMIQNLNRGFKLVKQYSGLKDKDTHITRLIFKSEDIKTFDKNEVVKQLLYGFARKYNLKVQNGVVYSDNSDVAFNVWLNNENPRNTKPSWELEIAIYEPAKKSNDSVNDTINKIKDRKASDDIISAISRVKGVKLITKVERRDSRGNLMTTLKYSGADLRDVLASIRRIGYHDGDKWELEKGNVAIDARAENGVIILNIFDEQY